MVVAHVFGQIPNAVEKEDKARQGAQKALVLRGAHHLPEFPPDRRKVLRPTLTFRNNVAGDHRVARIANRILPSLRGDADGSGGNARKPRLQPPRIGRNLGGRPVERLDHAAQSGDEISAARDRERIVPAEQVDQVGKAGCGWCNEDAVEGNVAVLVHRVGRFLVR